MKLKSLLPELVLVISACLTSVANAVDFGAMISPPRLELQAAPGSTLREQIEIHNTRQQTAEFNIRTADWDMDGNGKLTFHTPDLQPGSCRPWTRIERRTIHIAPDAGKRYRIEIDIPADAPTGECRLALLFEAPEQEHEAAAANNISLPIRARVAVIIYVTVGDARPDLVVQGAHLDTVHGESTPVIQLRNRGDAHGRAGGFVTVTDARQRKFEYRFTPLPLLPGMQRDVPLQRAGEADKVTPVPPLDITGKLEWQTGALEFSQHLDK